MEVATQTVLNFDLNSGKRRPFSSYFGSQLRSPDSPKNDAFQHPAEIKCYDSELSASAAMNVQKFYRGYRTRRLLADSAVVVEELWWQAINFARLSHSTISFFNFLKPETAAARWIRISLNASKVGKGLSKDAKAQKLAFQHWIEAIDPRHRYGHGLHIYYEKWCKADTGQPFFYWLDVGDGKEVDLPKCPRLKLRQQCIKYLGPQEREHYEYAVVEGKIVQKQTERFLDTNNRLPGAKWIFVMSTSKRLYAGEKKKGVFHHSSFLAGGATLAAGRLVVENGTLTVLHFCHRGPYQVGLSHSRASLCYHVLSLSRHTVDITALLKKDLTAFYHFLKLLESTLTKSKISCDQIHKANEDYENYEYDNSYIDGSAAEVLKNLDSCQPDIPDIKEDKNLLHEKTEESQTETKDNYRTSLSGVLQCPKSEVPKTAILQRIKSKRAAKSYELGHQLSLKWSTGAGPRIGCIADYPPELRLQALEFTNVCPKTSTHTISL